MDYVPSTYWSDRYGISILPKPTVLKFRGIFFFSVLSSSLFLYTQNKLVFAYYRYHSADLTLHYSFFCGSPETHIAMSYLSCFILNHPSLAECR